MKTGNSIRLLNSLLLIIPFTQAQTDFDSNEMMEQEALGWDTNL